MSPQLSTTSAFHPAPTGGGGGGLTGTQLLGGLAGGVLSLAGFPEVGIPLAAGAGIFGSGSAQQASNAAAIEARPLAGGTTGPTAGYGGPNPFATSTHINAPTAGAVTSASTSSGRIAPAGTVSAGMNPTDYANAIQQQYGSAIQGYTGEKANAMAANPINLQDVQNVFDLQKNQAQNQADNQVNTYNTQKSGIQSQQSLSLAQLADMIRGQSQGLQAQLGATGAGSSSASLLGNYALGRQQNQNVASINTQAGGNIANVNAQIQQVQNTLKPYLDTLEATKQQQLHNIMSNYNDLMARLESSIGQAQGEEKARLALFGQTLTQAASDSIAALNNGVAQQKQAYVDSITNAKSAAPAYQAPALQQAPAPITAPNLSPFQVNSGAGNATASPGIQGGTLADILKQQQQNAVA